MSSFKSKKSSAIIRNVSAEHIKKSRSHILLEQPGFSYTNKNEHSDQLHTTAIERTASCHKTSSGITSNDLYKNEPPKKHLISPITVNHANICIALQHGLSSGSSRCLLRPKSSNGQKRLTTFPKAKPNAIAFESSYGIDKHSSNDTVHNKQFIVEPALLSGNPKPPLVRIPKDLFVPRRVKSVSTHFNVHDHASTNKLSSFAALKRKTGSISSTANVQCFTQTPKGNLANEKVAIDRCVGVTKSSSAPEGWNISLISKPMCRVSSAYSVKKSNMQTAQHLLESKSANNLLTSSSKPHAVLFDNRKNFDSSSSFGCFAGDNGSMISGYVSEITDENCSPAIHMSSTNFERDLQRQPGDGEDSSDIVQTTPKDGQLFDGYDLNHKDGNIEDQLAPEEAEDGLEEEEDGFLRHLRMDGDYCYDDIRKSRLEWSESYAALESINDNELSSLDDETIEDLFVEDAEIDITPSTDARYSDVSSDKNRETSDEVFIYKPATIQSVFSNCSPVLNFGTKMERIEPLPPHLRKLLKWKMSPITPVVVRNTVMRSGFKPSKKGQEWIGYFGKHMKSSGFRSLKECQKMNHFPGSFQLGRKDRLWRNISRMQTRYGKNEFGFVPQSFILPWDKKLLKTAWEEGSTKQRFILKPPASARGIGIRVIHKWSQIPTKKPVLIQKYLGRPYLINGNKFDLRLYVHVTSFDPLRIYLFEDGLVRFATCKYSSSLKHLSNRYMHLTNYSINKKSTDFQQNDDIAVCQGHKWSLKALWGFLQQKGINTDKIWERMKDIVIKTIISVEQCTNSLIKSNCRWSNSCFELFGFDVMLDDHLRPWLLEVNISPSLHSNSPLDVEIKGPMVKDMLNLCGYVVPDKKVMSANPSSHIIGTNGLKVTANYRQEKRKYSQELSADSKAKHSYFMQHFKSFDEKEMISFLLDLLTVNDIRTLVESEDELARCGRFQRIFPSTNKKYLQYFEQPRYLSALLYAWEVKYKCQKSVGISRLESYCCKGLHLRQHVTDTSNVPLCHIWNIAANSLRTLPSPRNGMYFSSTIAKPKQDYKLNLTSSNMTCEGSRHPSRKSARN